MKIVMSETEIEKAKFIAQDVASTTAQEVGKELWLKVKINNPVFSPFILQMLYSPESIDGIEFLGIDLLAINFKEPGGEETKKKIIEYINNL